MRFLIGNLKKKEYNALYYLNGWIEHHGTVSAGHYTAKVANRDFQEWLEYDDQKVSLVKNLFDDSFFKGGSKLPYILCFEQVSQSVPIKESKSKKFKKFFTDFLSKH